MHTEETNSVNKRRLQDLTGALNSKRQSINEGFSTVKKGLNLKDDIIMSKGEVNIVQTINSEGEAQAIMAEHEGENSKLFIRDDIGGSVDNDYNDMAEDGAAIIQLENQRRSNQMIADYNADLGASRRSRQHESKYNTYSDEHS